jgi:hypothetical protein
MALRNRTPGFPGGYHIETMVNQAPDNPLGVLYGDTGAARYSCP